MNLEEAKLSVGKIVRVDVSKDNKIDHLGDHEYKLEYVNDRGLCTLSLTINNIGYCEVHHSNIYIAESKEKYKIGDEVVLRPETKPYTFFSIIGGNEVEEIDFNLKEDIYYTVSQVYEDGDVWIKSEVNDVYVPIGTKHIKHANENTHIDTLSVDLEVNNKELRLSIFNGNTSRTLEEMKAIEAWLLGE